MLNKTVYISGRVTGLPEHTYTQIFEDAEKELRKKGYNPINPLKIKHPPGIELWCDFMRGCIKTLSDCDAIFMLHNYKDSKGAMVELQVANHLELDVMHQHRFMKKK